VRTIIHDFPITDVEYNELEFKFGKLTWHAAHELKKKNSKNNYTDDAEDIKQELQMSMLRAGSYYKRQIYVEKCFAVAKKYVKDVFLSRIISELENLWANRTRHGANKQKFGEYQEKLLYKIVRKIVPKKERPDKKERLKIDSKFATYCKAIVWNGQKSMGKKISREKTLRNGIVSLSEFDHLC
jgi:hypothetical protein